MKLCMMKMSHSGMPRWTHLLSGGHLQEYPESIPIAIGTGPAIPTFGTGQVMTFDKKIKIP